MKKMIALLCACALVASLGVTSFAETPKLILDDDITYVFVNGNGATFNKVGTMILEATADQFVYEVNHDGSLSELDAVYDEYEGGFVFQTRTLGNYIITDVELDLSLAVADEKLDPAPAVDEDEGGFVFQSRSLGGFVISDADLDLALADEKLDPVPSVDEIPVKRWSLPLR